jgi:hypothetical protein
MRFSWAGSANPCISGDLPQHSLTRTAAWEIGIAIASILYFLTYFYPIHLHDPAHYATEGISMVRDHKNLIYPYAPLGPNGTGNAYEYLQNNTIRYDVRTQYPAKLYTAIYGFVCLLNGKMRLEYLQWMTFGSFLIGNIFLYLIGRRFFIGIDLFLFLVSVIFLPMMRFAILPQTDGAAYSATLALLWLCLCARINPITLGLYAGILAHLRGQMLFNVLIFPFIYAGIGTRRYFGALIPLTFGFIITYGAANLLFNLAVHSAVSTTPEAFYVSFFQNDVYGLANIGIVANKLISSIVDLFETSQLFTYAIVALLLTLLTNMPLQRNAAFAAILYVALPLCLYALDRYAPVQTRYYLFAAPLICLAAFTAAREMSSKPSPVILTKAGLFILAALTFAAWYTTYGFPIGQLKAQVIASGMHYLDFDGVEEALRTNFKDDDIVIVNHSLPTGLSRLHNVIYVPPYKLFMEGDNTKISGIVFVYGTTPPNNFFKPKDWISGDTPPPAFTDHKGIAFRLVYVGTSKIVGSDGSTSQLAFFCIYKNIGRAPINQ